MSGTGFPACSSAQHCFSPVSFLPDSTASNLGSQKISQQSLFFYMRTIHIVPSSHGSVESLTSMIKHWRMQAFGPWILSMVTHKEPRFRSAVYCTSWKCDLSPLGTTGWLCSGCLPFPVVREIHAGSKSCCYLILRKVEQKENCKVEMKDESVGNSTFSLESTFTFINL